MTLVRGLQERAARALPAEHVEHVGGWWLRHAPRCSWWVGTVLPHGEAGAADLTRRIADVETFYAGRGSTTRFQVSPGACPAELDAVLAARAYRRGSPMSLQTASAVQVVAQERSGSIRVRLTDRPTADWFEAWTIVHGHGDDDRSERDLLDRVAQPSTYATATSDGHAIAVARAVADAGWAGVFGLATIPEARGKGAARTVLAALAGWAPAHDAGRLYLQVGPDNTPALRLYERVGFTEVCAYHYRTAPPQAS